MNIIALDCGTRLGWATWIDGNITSGVQTFDLARGESPGMRWLRFRRWLKKMIKDTTNPNYEEDYIVRPLLVFEQAHHRGGAATSVGVGFVTILQDMAAEWECETLPVHSSTLKKFATGSGKASKTDMIAAANKIIPLPPMLSVITDDNQADALHLLLYGAAELGININQHTK